MLTSLGLRNFKAFGEQKQQGRLSRITLIYGPNSGGKSSIIQTLLMLKQTALEAGDASTVWGLVTRGEYTDLGSFPALIHEHNLDRELGVSIAFSVEDSQIDTHMDYHGVADLDHLGREHIDDSGALSRVAYQLSQNGKALIDIAMNGKRGGWETNISVGGASFLYRVADTGMRLRLFPQLNLYELERILEREQNRLPELERALVRERARIREFERENAKRRLNHLAYTYDSDSEVIIEPGQWMESVGHACGKMQALLREPDIELEKSLEMNLNLKQMITFRKIHDFLIDELDSIRYLGPFRSHPERLYRNPGRDSYFTGIKGEFTHNRLYYQPGLINRVNEWLDRFHIPYEMDVHRIGDIAISGEYTSIVLVDKRTDTPVTLADVGYGVNQFLPIIVEGIDWFSGSRNRILCIEQPEIHLHPKLQAEIADLMIETSDGDDHQNSQWIVETHSELMVLRLQRRIREGRIKSSDVSILYVDPNDVNVRGSSIKELRLDDEGNFIDDWPDGFFEESFDELMARGEPRHAC